MILVIFQMTSKIFAKDTEDRHFRVKHGVF